MSFKRIVTAILTVILLISCMTVFAAETLPDCFMQVEMPTGTQSPFKPKHKYACMQNPPDFSWPMVGWAESYDVTVCSDEALLNEIYGKSGIKNHYYNFKMPFESGTYYWAVRANGKSGSSEWSAPRRFRIGENYTVFTPPSGAQIADKVPLSHPRIWFTEESIDSFRNLANTKNGKKILEMMLNKNAENMAAENPKDPTDADIANETAIEMGFRCDLAALCYVFTDNAEYADYGIDVLMELCTWDMENNATSYTVNDQAFFSVLSSAAMAYDWLYCRMTEGQRTTVRDMLKARFDVVKDKSLEILRKNPYNSHIWSYFGNYGIACMALCEDIDGVKDYFSEMLELYLANLAPMSTEDGGWSKGTAYWTYAFTRDKFFMDALLIGGYVNCYDKAWAQNEYLWSMYMMPYGSYGSFGDGSNLEKQGLNGIMGLSKLGKYTENKICYWLRNQIGTIDKIRAANLDAILYADTLDEVGEMPIQYPNSHLFKDQGIVAMHSDVMAKERISMYFRSGDYGSYNHMHADQNSFMIEAFGERLAIKSGYYDSYHSEHDSGFTRQTFAHNTVTVDGGIGQKDDDIDADGNVDMFLTHHDFDLAVGDATKAYDGALSKFKRYVIYVRPDVYVLVDDLEAKSGTASNFEWRLNAPENTLSSVGTSGAKIENGCAALDVDIVYPTVTTDGVQADFTTPSGISISPKGAYEGSAPQDRICFRTPKTERTKIVSVIGVHKTDAPKNDISVKEENGCINLKFDNDTTVVVNVGNENLVGDGYAEFSGVAAVYNDKSAMLVGGNCLKLNGKTFINAEREISAVAGKSLICISASDDGSASISYGKDFPIKNISVLTAPNGDSPSLKTGVQSEVSGGIAKFYMQSGNYTFYTDETSFLNTNEIIPTNVKVLKENGAQTAKVTWNKSKKSLSCDVSIDGTVYKNVQSPFEFETDGKKRREIRVRSLGSGGTSAWSEAIYLEVDGKMDISGVHFLFADSKNEETDSVCIGGNVLAEAGVYNGSGSDVSLILAQYDRDGALKNVKTADLDNRQKGTFSRLKTAELTVDDGDVFKAYMWNLNEAKPYYPVASTAGEGFKLSAIMIDGDMLKNFSADVLQYNYTLSGDCTVPVVKGILNNGADVAGTKYIISPEGSKAEIFVGESVYTVNFELAYGSGQDEPIPLISDFEQFTKDMSYRQYCEYVGKRPSTDITDDVENSLGKIPQIFKLGCFEVNSQLCSSNSQRKISEISAVSGLNNCYFITTDASLYQPSSVDPWIVSAFTGSKITAGSVVYDFSEYSVPWVGFKVNRECEVLVFSDRKPSFCTEESGWIHTALDIPLYRAKRTRNGVVTDVPEFKNVYIRAYNSGDRVVLNNENIGMGRDIPYVTVIRFK